MGIFPCLLLFRRSHHAPTTLTFLENNESIIFVNENRGKRDRGSMEVMSSRNGNGNGGDEFEFWPIEHPIEPLDGDRPVQCPMPNTSSPVNDESLHGEHLCGSFWKKAADEVQKKEARAMMDATEAHPPPVRKRHHSAHTNNHGIKPLLRMPPIYPYPQKDFTIFQLKY